MTRSSRFEVTGRLSCAAGAFALALASCGGGEPPPRDATLTADPPLAPSGAPQADDGAATTEVQRGIAFIKLEKYVDAKAHLEIAMSTRPTAEGAFYLGVAREKTGDRKGAEDAYKRAFALDGRMVEAAGNLAALYLEPAAPGDKPRADEAIALLKDATSRAPDDVRLLQNLAYAYGQKGDVESSSKAYEAALAKGESAELRFAYGSMLFEQKQPEKAAPELKKALDGTREDAPTLVTLGRMLGASKAYAECVRAFDRAIKLKATDPEWFVRRGTCRHELKDEAGARADYEQAVKVDPNFAAAHYYLGLSFLADHKPQSAAVALEKAKKLGAGTPIGKSAEAKLAELPKKK